MQIASFSGLAPRCARLADGGMVRLLINCMRRVPENLCDAISMKNSTTTSALYAQGDQPKAMREPSKLSEFFVLSRALYSKLEDIVHCNIFAIAPANSWSNLAAYCGAMSGRP